MDMTMLRHCFQMSLKAGLKHSFVLNSGFRCINSITQLYIQISKSCKRGRITRDNIYLLTLQLSREINSPRL